MVFDRQWFKEHQKGLLFLCNNSIIKYWFRWILRIHKDISFKTKIYKLEPNCFTWQTSNPNEFTTDFRTNDKFARRIYFAFKYVWYMLHYFDGLFNYYRLELSFGFDTLTAYPDANAETNSCDGASAQTNCANWAALYGGTGSNQDDSNVTINFPYIDSKAPVEGDGYNSSERAFWFFYTSALTSSANISAATLSIRGQGVATNDFPGATPSVNIYGTSSTSTTGLATTDYGTAQATAFSSAVDFASLADAYVDFILNASGIAAISKTGLSRFCGREATYDAANNEIPWTGNKYMYWGTWAADWTGTTSDPKLVITYTLGATFLPHIIN